MRPPTPDKPLSKVEFIALMAMLFSTIAFSIDAMLPALPEIAGTLSPDAPNQAQLVLTSFVLGMGVGTLFTGPLSDAFGRRPVIVGGAILYTGSAILAWRAQSLELLLAARVFQGLGAAGPRVVALAIVRDLFSGREMARIMSFVLMVFALVPAIAPLLGAGIIWLSGWREIFLAFAVFSVFTVGWLYLRQPETLPVDRRRPFRLPVLAAGIREVMSSRQVVLIVAIQALSLGVLFGNLSTTQQIFDQVYGFGRSFPWWFAGIAIFAASASLLNARIVGALGMKQVAAYSFAGQIGVSGLALVALSTGVLTGLAAFPIYLIWTTGIFFMVGLTLGNLNALAMEPLGHLAGMAASIIGSFATILAVVVAIPIGFAFDGTPVPVIGGTLLCMIAALGLLQGVRPDAAAFKGA